MRVDENGNWKKYGKSIPTLTALKFHQSSPESFKLIEDWLTMMSLNLYMITARMFKLLWELNAERSGQTAAAVTITFIHTVIISTHNWSNFAHCYSLMLQQQCTCVVIVDVDTERMLIAMITTKAWLWPLLDLSYFEFYFPWKHVQRQLVL